MCGFAPKTAATTGAPTAIDGDSFVGCALTRCEAETMLCVSSTNCMGLVMDLASGIDQNESSVDSVLAEAFAKAEGMCV